MREREKREREKGEGWTDGLTRPIFEDTCVCPKKCAERKIMRGRSRVEFGGLLVSGG